ncbi:MAG: hypothetical protein ACI3ZB_07660, partial [Prevotella sp.]
GDSDRCFATFYFYQGNPTVPIKPRFPNHKTAFFASENGVLQSENGVLLTRKRRFLTIKCKSKRVFLHHCILILLPFAFPFPPSERQGRSTPNSVTEKQREG